MLKRCEEMIKELDFIGYNYWQVDSFKA